MVSAVRIAIRVGGIYFMFGYFGPLSKALVTFHNVRFHVQTAPPLFAALGPSGPHEPSESRGIWTINPFKGHVVLKVVETLDVAART